MFLLLLIATQATLFAQTRYLLKTVAITIPTVLDLQIISGANPVVDFNVTSKIDNGIELLAATTFTYRSNKAWFVTIKAGSADFTGGVSGSPMPASVIKYRLNGATLPYAPLSNLDQSLLANSGSKNARGTGSASIDFQVNPGYNYPPSQNYSLQVIYTISNL
ncbi:hypothetical protein [Daejeonella sp.]|uniref:hypothetical protein n=1 Tax=Daejeonella sp. TaxID=2805397 RepID=UPI0030EF3FC1